MSGPQIAICYFLWPTKLIHLLSVLQICTLKFGTWFGRNRIISLGWYEEVYDTEDENIFRLEISEMFWNDETVGILFPPPPRQVVLYSMNDKSRQGFFCGEGNSWLSDVGGEKNKGELTPACQRKKNKAQIATIFFPCWTYFKLTGVLVIRRIFMPY